MNTQETIANNRLIAEFMGIQGDYSDLPEGMCGFYNGQELAYHKDWNQIMPVVEKIESIIFNSPAPDTYYNVQILGGCYVVIISNNGDELIINDLGKSKLECLYMSLISFIKWHNENKEA